MEQRGAEWVLSGVKDWVTNAAQAHRILVLARAPDDKLAAIVVDPSRPEVRLDELPRPGMHGSSLCRVEVQNLKFSPERDRVGGPAGDVASVLASAADLKGLAFACRAVGAARAVLEECDRLMAARRPSHGVALHRYGRLLVEFHASRAVYRSARAGDIPPVVAKVFCGEALATIVDHALQLNGGDGYAGSRILSRTYQDCASLLLAGTPNDRLVSTLAAR